MIEKVIQILMKFFTNTDARSSKMRKNTLVMFAIRGVSILVSFLSAPIMLHHVDRADYGVLLTLTSLVSWIGMMDIGLGNGLRNKLPEYIAEGQVEKARKAVSSCYGALFLYVLVIVIVFLAISPHIDWISFLNSPHSDRNEISRLVNIIVIAFCVQFIFGLLNSILFAFQMPAIQSGILFLSQLVSFIALIIQVFVFNVSSIFQIGLVNCIIPPIVLFVASVVLFRGRFKKIAPSLAYLDFKIVGGILSLGVKFFILQIITIVLFQANNIIISNAVSPEAVVEYNLAYKYISVLTLVFNIIIAPIWSATTDAYVRRDFPWIKKTMQSVRRVCLFTIGFGCIMVSVSSPIYHLWLGDESVSIHIETTLLIFIYVSFEMLYKVYGTIINGTGKIHAQMVITGLIAVFYIPLALLLGKLWGLSGVLIANTFVFICNYLWSKIQCTKLINESAVGFWNK